MGLRHKLLLPVILMMGVFGGFLHLLWAPTQLQHARNDLIDHQQQLLQALKPDLVRHLLASDMAALYSSLDQQMEIHNGLWVDLYLIDEQHRPLYPLDRAPVSDRSGLIRIKQGLGWEGSPLGVLNLVLDGRGVIQSEQVRIWQLEILSLVTIGLLVIGSFLIQDRLIHRPLVDLKEIANRLRQGDYDVKIPEFGKDEVGQLAVTFASLRAALVSDIAQREQYAEKLRARLSYERALAACSQTLMEDKEGAVESALGYLLKATGVSRISVFENFTNEQEALCARMIHTVLTEAHSSAVLENAVFENEECQCLPERLGCSRWRAALGEDRPLMGLIEEFPVNEREQLASIGIRALLVLPIWIDSKWYGAISFEDTETAREWQSSNILLLRTAAEMLAAYIHRKQTERLCHEAYHDPLTGLPNRRLLHEYLQRELAHATRHGEVGGVLFIDLDRFKTINDSLGHTTGDALLVQVSTRLLGMLREDDIAARLGGDEFVVLLPSLGQVLETAAERAQSVVEKLQQGLGSVYLVKDHELHITPSIGIILYPTEADTAEEVIKRADTAMYRAKTMGRNTFCFFHPSMQAAADARLTMEKDLRLALIRNEFELYYQPQVDIRIGQIVGMEALLRWNHPLRGFIPPSQFIAIAEESGLIIPIGDWVMGTACAEFNRWLEQGITGGLKHMAINLSPRQFQQLDFVDKVCDMLSRSRGGARYLELEITENMLIASMDDAVSKIRKLRDQGVVISIDDFGTGYSSLAYLKKLPIDKLKIDRSFVQNITQDPSDAIIVEATIAIASQFGISLVAEGVETQEQIDFLRLKGCNICQGYYLGRPLPAEQIMTRLRGTADVEHKPMIVG